MTETTSGFGHSNLVIRTYLEFGAWHLVLHLKITNHKSQTRLRAGGQANSKFEKSMTETTSGFGHSNLVIVIYLEFGACVLELPQWCFPLWCFLFLSGSGFTGLEDEQDSRDFMMSRITDYKLKIQHDFRNNSMTK